MAGICVLQIFPHLCRTKTGGEAETTSNTYPQENLISCRFKEVTNKGVISIEKYGGSPLLLFSLLASYHHITTAHHITKFFPVFIDTAFPYCLSLPSSLCKTIKLQNSDLASKFHVPCAAGGGGGDIGVGQGNGGGDGGSDGWSDGGNSNESKSSWDSFGPIGPFG